MDKKITVMTISDHPLLPSGVGTQTQSVIRALLDSDKFDVISLAGAIKHNDYQPTNIAQSKPLDYTKDLTPMSQYTPDSKFIVQAGKASPAQVMSSEDFLAQQSLQDPTGFTQVRNNVKVNNKVVGEIDVMN